MIFHEGPDPLNPLWIGTCSASGKARNRHPRLKFMIGNAPSAWDHHSFNYENVAVSCQHIYGKSKRAYTFLSLIAPNNRRAGYQRWSGRACFCHNHRRSDNQKTKVGEASAKILNIWTNVVFLIYHIGDKQMLR